MSRTPGFDSTAHAAYRSSAMSRYHWYAFTAPGAAFGPSGTEIAR